MTQSISTKLDKIKTKIFIHKNAAFLAALLCNIEVKIVEEDCIAYTNGTTICISKQALEEYPEEWLITYLTHELWHIARLHFIRGKNKEDKKRWNLATDCVINIDLINNGYEGLDKIGAYYDFDFEGYSEEEIYEYLLDLRDEDLPDQAMEDLKTINDPREDRTVLKAVQNALMAAKDQGLGCATEIRDLLEKETAPKVNWKKLLKRFCTDAMAEDTSWRIRSKRYPDMYMPGKIKEDGQLTHLAFFIDTSGSISDKEIEEFNTEVKAIHKDLNPSKMTVIQFDEEIQKETVILGTDKWKPIKIVGNGGTDLSPVRNWIQKNKPTACVVFSDLWCDPMEYIKTNMFWIIINNSQTNPGFGTTAYITVES